MSAELTVSLRVNALLDQARRALGEFRTELAAVRGAAGSTSAATTQQASATAAATTATKGAAQATQQATAAAEQHTAAKRAEAAAQKEAGAAAAAAAARTDAATRSMNSYGVSAGQTKAALRQLPAQFTDIFTSLQAGQAPLTVLIQQGGQIKDSFGGIRPALSQLAALITPTVAGLALASAGVGVLALAYIQGQNQTNEFNRSLVLTGNYAGLAGGALTAMADRVSSAVGTSVGGARETLQALVSTGKVSREALEPTARAIELVIGLSGRTRAAVVGDFASMSDGVAKWALKANESYNFLRLAQFEQIKTLEEQGKATEAQRVASEALATALGGRLSTNLGSLERAWQAVKNAASGAWDSMLGVGREEGPAERVARLRRELERANQPLQAGAAAGGSARPRGVVRAELEFAERNLVDAQTRAGNRAFADQQAKAQLKAAEAVEAAKVQFDKNAKLEKDLEAYRRNVATLKGTSKEVSAEEQARTEKGIRESVLGKPAASSQANKALRDARANAQVAQAQIAADQAALEASIKAGDAVIVQAVAEGNLSIQIAFDARLAQLQTDNAAQRDALTRSLAETEQALTKAKTDAERGPLREKKVQIEGKLRLLDLSLDEAARQLKTWKADQERELASITAKVRLEVSALTGKFDSKAVEDQLKLQLEADRKAAGRIADPAERAAAVERIDLLVRAGTAQAQFNLKIAEAQRIQQALAVQEEAINGQAQRGQISQVEAEARIASLRAQQVPTLQAIAVELERIRAALPPEAAVAIAGMDAAIGKLRNSVSAATPVVVELGTRLRNTAIDGLADAAATAVTNFQSLRGLIAGTLRQISADIIRSGIKRALSDQFKMEGGSSSGGIFSLIVSGIGSLFKFAEGGQIKGPGTGTSDSIPAIVDGQRPIAVSNGEFIQPTKAVSHYGLGMMEAIRTLKFPKPRFAFGGLVRAQQRARYATGGQVAAGGSDAVQVSVRLETRGTPSASWDSSSRSWAARRS